MCLLIGLKYSKLVYNFFLEKKQLNLPRAALDLAWVSKVEVIPNNTAPKSYFPLFVNNYYSDP